MRKVNSRQDMEDYRDYYWSNDKNVHNTPLIVFSFIDALLEDIDTQIVIPSLDDMYGENGSVEGDLNWDEATTYNFFIFTDDEKQEYPEIRNKYGIEIEEALANIPNFEIFNTEADYLKAIHDRDLELEDTISQS